ncbi:MAG: beta-sandwich domain-containing protein, partial [Bryobacteraceae bacterium]
MARILLLGWMCVVTLTAQTAATLAGSVQDPAGSAVPNATVRVRPYTGGTASETTLETALEAKTAADGSFRFRDLPPGEYILEVTSRALKPHQSRVRLEGGSEKHTTVRLEIPTLATAITVEDKVDDLRAEVEADYNQNKTITSIDGQGVTQYNPVSNYDVLRLLPGVMSPAGAAKDRFSVPTNIRGAAAWGTVETVDDYPAINITPVSAEDGGYTASFSSIIPSLALHNITLATGGLGVTYGQAAGGVVKSSIKQGLPGRAATSVRLEGSGVGEGVM